MESKESYTYDEAYNASLTYFGGDELAARVWVEKYAKRDAAGNICELSPERRLGSLVSAFAHEVGQQRKLAATTVRPEVTEVRPKELECDVVRFQNNKEKWVAFVGLLNGYPYEIFTGLQDDEEGIVLPKTVTHGKILKQVNEDGSRRYDFQFENKRGYKTTVEGLSEKFNPEYWNYAKLISGVLRYRMPLDHVVKLVSSLQLQSENINTWKVGVERALKKYIPGSGEEVEEDI